MKKRMILVLLVFCLSVMTAGCYDVYDKNPQPGNDQISADPSASPEENGSLKLFFFELGKADAFLIYNNKTTILIDTGEKGDGKDILQYMENNNLEGIDYMFITHFDKDHVGGANKILGNTTVGKVYTGSFVKSGEEYDSYESKVKEKKIDVVALTEPLTFETNGIKVEVNVPAREMYEEDMSNNSSLIIRITYGENKFLFMGDALSERIREYLGTSPEPCDVIKMPHHGSYMGCLTELLMSLKPEYAVITSSKEEKEADATKELLDNFKIKLYRTRKGSILMQSDGKEINVLQVS